MVAERSGPAAKAQAREETRARRFSAASGPRFAIAPLMDERWAACRHGEPVRLPLGRRPLREPRPLRDGAPPLPLHRGQRRRLRPECAFDDLGNAIRKIRIDLGVPITSSAPDHRPRQVRQGHGLLRRSRASATAPSTATRPRRLARSTSSPPYLQRDSPVDVTTTPGRTSTSRTRRRGPVVQRVAVRELPPARGVPGRLAGEEVASPPRVLRRPARTAAPEPALRRRGRISGPATCPKVHRRAAAA